MFRWPWVKKRCKWCAVPKGYCDCEERINCNKAGEIGHWGCGTWSCGCPRWIGCSCPKIEEEKRQLSTFRKATETMTLLPLELSTRPTQGGDFA